MSIMKKIFILTVFVLSCTIQFTFAQGCSDAGFCTIDHLKPTTDISNAEKNQIKFGAFVGGADYSIFTWGNYLEYNRQVSERFSFDTKLTSLAQSGNGIAAFGLGDLFITGNLKATEKFRLTLGAKIPLTNGNKKDGNLPLPLDYQSSLGTFDFIAGVGYRIDKLQLVFALQQPLSQNKNAFLAENYPEASPLRAFQSTNQFNRKGDVLLRLSYPIQLAPKFTLVPSLLPIYHLGTDRYTNNLDMSKEIVGSDGLTLNGNAYLDYQFNAKNALQLNMGLPFIVRDARPDGLTRSFVANIEYRIRF
jgi:hypothetical protein